MTDPLISIVLPTYNGSRYLAQSIQSCVGQTYQNWELIVVDDASSDATPAIIGQFLAKDSRIRMLRHCTNRRLPAALNTGFADAHGEFFTWTSDDNMFRPQALARMAQFLTTHLDVGVVYCDFSKIDEHGQLLGAESAAPPETLAIENCIRCCFLYRKWVAGLVGEYSESLFLAEDYDFWLRASLVTRLAPLPENLYLYRFHPATLTATRREAIAAATALALSRHLPDMHWLSAQAKARGYVRLWKAVKARGERRRALRFLALAAATAPGFFLREGLTRIFHRARSGRH